jgi:DmsE family decaheme c-type cytochrome
MKTGIHFVRRVMSVLRLSHVIGIGLLLLGLVSCTNPPKPRHGIDNYAGWPNARTAQGRTAGQRDTALRKVVHAPRKGPFAPLNAELPKVPDAEYIREDELCMTCHEAHVIHFKEKNVHRQFSCEECHGPASEHVGTRGQEVGKILNVKRLGPAQRSEICLRCHEKEVTPAHVAQWRISTHAHSGISCSDCHTAHHDVPPGTPTVNPEQSALSTTPGAKVAKAPAAPKADPQLRTTAATKASRTQAETKPDEEKPPSLRGSSQRLLADSPETCYRCHEGSHRMLELTGPHRIGTGSNFKCTTCHGAQGTLTAQSGKELCLNCHTNPLSANWHDSTHNQADLQCIDCHNPHPKLDAPDVSLLKQGILDGLPRPMMVSQTTTCVKCHESTKQLVEIASPHQVGGINQFLCTTCHDPHGRLRDSARTDLCLTCHTGTPTAAWRSSVHHLQGIACTDCHDPHPNTHVQKNVDIRLANIRRPQRLPMSVNEPDTCYSCHPQVYAQTLLPSHHPIFEGKMNCSSCHDSHGQALRLLVEPQLNLVCYKCHSEVQGPFVYEHPPVTQDCSICHAPHGSVQNNLLIQPTTFLCLRCHSGHRTGPAFHDAKLLGDIGTSPQLQKAFYSDCTQCHSQIHGSDVPSPNNAHAFAR